MIKGGLEIRRCMVRQFESCTCHRKRCPVTSTADLIIAGRLAHTFDPGGPDTTAIAVTDGVIVATAADVASLAALEGPETRRLVDPDLVLMPSFSDTHNHLSWTSQDDSNVDVSAAGSVADIVAALRRRAEQTPVGEWIVGRRLWHESVIDERRLPTAAELDRASTDHPIFLQRGGHVGVANSAALALAGITADTPDPDGGTVGRDAAGRPTGVLVEFPAMAPVAALLPRLDEAARVDALERTCRLYNSRGLGAVRDPGVDDDDVDIYRALRDRGGLSVRSRPMLRLDPSLDVAGNLERMSRFRARPGEGDDLLRIEGIKIFTDGGVEGGWLSAPYENASDYCGHAFVEPDELEVLVSHAVRLGWKVGAHAVGDNAVRMVVDVYERVMAKVGPLPPRALVIEHAFFADAPTRRRAVAAGIPITVQPPLLYALAGNMVTHWGSARTAEVMPVADWLADGAELAAGSDCNVAPFDPMLSVWGFVTRGTHVAGVQGRHEAVDRHTAFRLYTADAARLTGEHDRRGRLAIGQYADIVAFAEDPMTCDVDRLPELAPVLTLVGGVAHHDSRGLAADSR